jgi:hypothetical protein
MATYLINSNNRKSGTVSDFTIDLKINDTYDKIVVLSASIPKTYYLIDDNNDTFQVVHNSITYNITMDHGNYSASNFLTALKTKLNAAVPLTFDITFNRQTGLYTYTCTANPSFVFTTQLYEQLGFEANSTNIFTSNSLTSTQVVNFINEDTLLINSDICRSDGSNNKTSILCEVFSSTTVDFGHVSYLCPSPKYFSRNMRLSQSGTYRFYLTDENGTPIICRGGNIVFSLLMYKDIETAYQKSMMYELANKGT